MELLWLDGLTDPDSGHPLYEVVEPHGVSLVDLRSAFLSEEKVRGAYLGKARRHFQNLEAAEGSGNWLDRRAGKDAMHMARLVNQGYALLTEGHLPIRVEEPEWYLEFAEAGPTVWKDWFTGYEKQFATVRSCLPTQPDRGLVEQWLVSLRRDRFELFGAHT
jgi:uncharacterized protein